jgi:hypothetical protein
MGAEASLDAFDEGMEREHLEFLDAVSTLAGKVKHGLAEAGEIAATATDEGHGMESAATGRLGGLEKVGRSAGGGEKNELVARAAVGLDGAGEDAVKAVIVGHTGEVGRIGESDGGEGGTIGPEMAGELFGEVHSIGEAAPISSDKNLSASEEGVAERFGEILELGDKARFPSLG